MPKKTTPTTIWKHGLDAFLQANRGMLGNVI